MNTQAKSMQQLVRQIFPQKATHHNPAPSVIPEDKHEQDYIAQAQWNDTFQESLLDFQHKFEEEEMARSAGEHARQDEFDRTMTNFGDIFLKNHLRRQELNKEIGALQEERFQRADAAREAIFVQGQQDRARAFEIEEVMREKRVEWYVTARKGLLSDGRQRLAEKCQALNAALVEQFDRLMDRQKEMMEVTEEQSSDQDTPIPVFPDESSGPVNSQSVTSLPPLLKTPSSPPSPRAENFIESNVRDSRSPSTRSIIQASSSPNSESLDSLTQPMSPESNDQQQQSPCPVEQADPEGSTQSDRVEEDEFQPHFMRSQEQRQETFLQDEETRNRRFRASQAIRGAQESKHSTIFDQQMTRWSKKSSIDLFCFREEERSRRENQRSIAFQNAESQRGLAFKTAMRHYRDQAYAEGDLEEIHFMHQEDILLELYERQAIQLNQLTEDQIVWLKFMRERTPVVSRRKGEAIPDSKTRRDPGFSLRAMVRGKLVQPSLPIPKVIREDPGFGPHSTMRGNLIQPALQIPKVTDVEPMQLIFERSQELRAKDFEKGAKERNRTFKFSEATHKAHFVKAQQKRKEIFDEAEESRESRFEEAQQQRESELQANERKREEDFGKNEAERNDQTRKAQETRAQQFQSMMSKLQQYCVSSEHERLKELELLGEELIRRRELPPGYLQETREQQLQSMMSELQQYCIASGEQERLKGLESWAKAIIRSREQFPTRYLNRPRWRELLGDK